jgi:hypothetical protein
LGLSLPPWPIPFSWHRRLLTLLHFRLAPRRLCTPLLARLLLLQRLPTSPASSAARFPSQARLAEVLAAVRVWTTRAAELPAGLDHRVMAALVKMLAAELFRAMPPPSFECPLSALQHQASVLPAGTTSALP